MAKHHMYDESPSIKRTEEGHTKVEKAKAHTAGKEEKGVEGEGFDIEAAHSHERLALHHKHMHEHMQLHHKHEVAHHHGEASAELHKKHHEEFKQMHNHHEAELKSMHMKHEKEAGMHGGKMAGAGGSTGEPIEKIEKNSKG